MASFGLIGALNTVLDLGVYAALTELMTVAPLVANLFSFSLGATSSYVLNGLITFHDIRANLFHAPQAFRSVLSAAICLGVSTGALWLALRFLPNMAAKGATLVATFFCGYALSRYWVYRPARAS